MGLWHVIFVYRLLLAVFLFVSTNVTSALEVF